MKTIRNNLVAFTLFVVCGTQAFATTEPISFTTDDGIEISAVIDGIEESANSQPAVVFIHQGGSDKSEWTKTALFKQVVAKGMVALAYDVRGHGQSGGKADFSTLFDDPNQAPKDLQAALAYIRSLPSVDKSRIAIVGASIGSNLAAMATALPEYGVKTAVAISGKAAAVYNLAGTAPDKLAIRSVFHIASEHEQDGLRKSWAEELYAVTANPRRLEIVASSNGHGVSIFADDPSLANRVMEWLLETLE